MERQDFVISFLPQDDTTFHLQVIESPAGQARGVLILPFTYKEIEPSLSKWKVPLDPPTYSKMADPGKPKSLWSPYDLGAALYEALFDGDIRECWDRAMGKTDGCMGLVLQFDGANPHSQQAIRLPWECLLNPKTTLPLARKSGFSFTRRLLTQGLVEDPPLPFPEPLKVVAVISNPVESPSFDAKRFEEDLREALSDQGVELSVLKRPTMAALFDRAEREPFHILHFIGHGGRLEPENNWVLAFQDRDGNEDFRTALDLTDALEGCRKTLRLVTLVACDGGAMLGWSNFNPFGGLAAELIHNGIPAVLAMQHGISVDAAKVFNRHIYLQLIKNHCLETGLEKARSRMFSELKKSMEWATPTLYTRTGDALFAPPSRPVIHINSIQTNLRSEDIAKGGDLLERLDYQRLFEGRRIRDPGNWSALIFRDLWDLQSKYERHTRLFFEGRAALSIWVALGFVFNKTTGKHLAVLQVNHANGATEYWRTDCPLEKISFQSELTENREGRGDLVVSITIGESVDPMVEGYLADRDLPFAKWLRLTTVTKGALLENDSEAAALAQIMVARIRSEFAKCLPPKIHLFLRAPSAFAVFLGRELNALSEIQLYEHEGHTYAPSILLRRNP